MLPVLGVLLLALGLRLYLLTGQSLWYDEGVSAYMTPRTYAEIAAATAVDIHPPLYYWLLATWAVPFGQGEVALRSLSVLLGTLMVWATWGLGRSLSGPAVGLAAAALLAVSPLAVQYSQEVRMYALAGLLAAAVAGRYWQWCARCWPPAATRRQRLTLTLGYGLLVAALLYTHYYGTLVILAQAPGWAWCWCGRAAGGLSRSTRWPAASPRCSFCRGCRSWCGRRGTTLASGRRSPPGRWCWTR